MLKFKHLKKKSIPVKKQSPAIRLERENEIKSRAIQSQMIISRDAYVERVVKGISKSPSAVENFANATSLRKLLSQDVPPRQAARLANAIIAHYRWR